VPELATELIGSTSLVNKPNERMVLSLLYPSAIGLEIDSWLLSKIYNIDACETVVDHIFDGLPFSRSSCVPDWSSRTINKDERPKESQLDC
jgi:hypothetical protein